MIAEAIGRVVQIQADLAAARALLREAGRGGAPICIPAGDERPIRYIMFPDGQRKVITDREHVALVPEEFGFLLDLTGRRSQAKVVAR